MSIRRTPTVVIAHSLGPLFILHPIEKNDTTFDSTIFVSPLLTKLNNSKQIDAANATFYKSDFNSTTASALFSLSLISNITSYAKLLVACNNREK
jgi:predicted alpha/beta hydrolase family esterase